jgi:5-oxoprolinase (ATP-hydrolysing) subunit A
VKGRVDLNVDIGEGMEHDEALLEFATSANVCCGEHAGSMETTLQTIELCRQKGVRIGVHPGYPDREGMGRRPIELHQTRIYLESVYEQTARFLRITPAAYIKPHGAFYNDTAVLLPGGWDVDTAGGPRRSRYEAGGVFLAASPGIQALMMLLRIHRIALMGLPGTSHEEVARRAGMRFFREGFADRAYSPEGLLVPRGTPGAVLEDPEEVRHQVLALAPEVDSLCLHGDTPDCVRFAENVYRTLRDAGYEVGP